MKGKYQVKQRIKEHVHGTGSDESRSAFNHLADLDVDCAEQADNAAQICSENANSTMIES